MENNIKGGIKFNYLIPFFTKEMKALLAQDDTINRYFILSDNACSTFRGQILKDYTKQNQTWFNKLCFKWYLKTLKV